jgi:hypothetical protein
MSTVSLLLPDYLHTTIHKIADNEHISVNQLVTTAITEKVSELATEKYLNSMAAKWSAQVFVTVMDRVNIRPPLPGDEM